MNMMFPSLGVEVSQFKEFSGSKNIENCELILKVLEYLDRANISHINSDQQEFISSFSDYLFKAFASPEFNIPIEYADRFIIRNITLSNIIAATSHGNTDRLINEVIRQGEDIVKILTLLSQRNRVKIEINSIFEKNSYYASLWWGNIISYAWNYNNEGALNFLNEVAFFDKLEKHLNIFDKASSTIKPVFYSYFQSTYIGEGCDKYVRGVLNNIIRNNIKYSDININPDFKKIAVVSTNFHRKHAVYRSISPYLYELKGYYHLTLIHFGEKIADIDDELFDEVIIPEPEKTNTIEKSISYVAKGNYGVIYFPDIGMNIPSIILSNARMSPIQITGSGHPVSTFGGEIDYFIGGKDVEILSEAEKNYSEKLVLIPGLGMEPVSSNYKIRNYQKDDDKTHILCNWGSNKINYFHLLNLKKISEGRKNTVFHFLGIHSHKFSYIPLSLELKELLGKQGCEVVTYSNLKFEDYMRIIEKCDFALDSFPFGGYNRIIDMLYCNKPVVTLMGKKSYNLVASKILENIDLSELIAKTDEEYVDISIRLIEDKEFFNKMKSRIFYEKLESRIFNSGNQAFFRKAIDYLIKNHSTLQRSRDRVIEIS